MTMTGEYSELEKDFYFASFGPRRNELTLLLKDEVGLVQSTRRVNNIQDEWNSGFGGEGDSESKVVKMEGSVCTRSRAMEEEMCDNKMEQESVALLRGFCLQIGIPVLPEDIGRQQNNNAGAGGRQKDSENHKSAGAHPKNERGGGGGGREESHWNPRGGPGGGGGGAGGGKRPPPPPSSSEPESVWNEISGSGETNEDPTTDDGERKAKSRKNSEDRRKSVKKRRPSGVDVVSSELRLAYSFSKTKISDISEQYLTTLTPSDTSLSRSSSKTSVKHHSRSDRGRRKTHRVGKPNEFSNNILDEKPSTASLGALLNSTSTTSLKRATSGDKERRKHFTWEADEFSSVFVNNPSPALADVSSSRASVRLKGRDERQRRKHYIWEPGAFSNVHLEKSNIFPVAKDQKGRATTKGGGGRPKNLSVALKKARKQYVEKLRGPFVRRQKRSSRMLPHPEGPPLVSNLDQIARLMKTEKGPEWLQWTGSEDDLKDEDAKQRTKFEKKGPVQPDLKTFMDSMSVLNRVNSILGLNPLRKLVGSHKSIEFKWVPRSREFIRMLINALVFFMISMSLFFSLLIDIFNGSQSLTHTHKIVRLDFTNHFLEATFLLLLTLFLTVWSVSCILELGVHYSQFYSRFNLGICLTKYDVTEGIHDTTVKHLATVIVFELFIVVLFFEGFVYFSLVRESCGFLGLSILRPFNFEFRESIYYPLVEIFGLFVFLYCFFSMNVVLLDFVVYAKALGNMAKRFNLRMAYAFGSLSERYEDGVIKDIRKVIPLKKLWAEHQIVASLFRNMSQVNSVVFGALLSSMVFQIVLVMWLFFDIFLEEHPPSLDGVNIEYSGTVKLAVALRPQKTEGERLVKAFAISAIVWLMYWLYGGVFYHAGEAITIGIYYVRRLGLMQCRKSKERRFILSMINSFQSSYWIGKQFQFTRVFLVGLMKFVIGASMVVVAFRPDRLSLTTYEQCSDWGFCTLIKAVKTVEDQIYVHLEDAARPPPPQLPIIIVTPGPPVNATLEERYLSNVYLEWTPCNSSGIYPLTESVVSGTVFTEWSPPLSKLQLPYVYKKRLISPSNQPSKQYIIYEAWTTVESLVPPIENCYGEDIINPPMDDCKNLGFAMPKRNNLTVKVALPPEKQLIALNQIPGYPEAEDTRFFCCYNYAINSENEVKACNLASKAELDEKCRLSASSSPLVSSFVNTLKKLRSFGAEWDFLASHIPFDNPNRTSWTRCLCQGNKTECKKWISNDSCWGRDVESFTDEEEKYFIKCKVSSKTGPWSNLDYISYPTLFQIEGDTDNYEQKLAVKDDCIPVGQQTIHPSTSNVVDHSKPFYDCEPDDFQFATTYFEDECRNPILYRNESTRWNQLLKIHIVYINSNRVACCVNYRLENIIRSKFQAKVCNKPNSEVGLENQCQSLYDANRAYFLTTYTQKWEALSNNPTKQAKLETDDFIVRCMCSVLPYVYKKYPDRFPNNSLHPAVDAGHCKLAIGAIH